LTRPNENIKEKAACENMSVAEGLIASLTGLRDTLRNGERPEEKFTMRTVDLNLEPRDYTPEDVKTTATARRNRRIPHP